MHCRYKEISSALDRHPEAHIWLPMMEEQYYLAGQFRSCSNPKLTPHQAREARWRIEAGETQLGVTRSHNVSQATVSRLAA